MRVLAIGTVAAALSLLGGCIFTRGPCGSAPCHQETSILVTLDAATTPERANAIAASHDCRLWPAELPGQTGRPVLECARVCIAGPNAATRRAVRSARDRIRRAFTDTPETRAILQHDGPIC